MSVQRRAAEPVRITVYAKPRARKSRILQADGLRVTVSVAAPPVDGAANAELIAVLAQAISAPPSALQVALGGASKRKMVVATGVSEAEVIERLARAVLSRKAK